MNEKQKKIISRTFQALMFIASAALLICGLVFKFGDFDIEQQNTGVLLVALSSLLTPSTIIGFWIKKWLNDIHKKEIKEIVSQIPLENSNISTSKQCKVKVSVNVPKGATTLLKRDDFEVYILKKTIFIHWEEAKFRNEEDFMDRIKVILNELSEVIRKQALKGN